MSDITGVSKESINGVKFTLVYNAASTFVEASATRSVKSKSLRQVASTNRCRYCLRFTNDKHEFYYFSPNMGISFARQLEVFIEASKDPRWHDDIKIALIIPLDSRIYIAEIERGEVIDERVLIVAAAQETINALHQGGQAMFCFAGGVTEGEIDLAAIEKLEGFELLIKKDRDAKPFYFISLAMLMTRSGLYHRAQLLCIVPILISIFVVGYAYVGYQAEIKRALLVAQERVDQVRIRTATENRERTSQGAANHSASVNLLTFLGAVKKAHALSADGVERISWNRLAIEIRGKSAQFPNSAVILGAADNWLFRLADGDWIVKRNQAAHADNRQPTVSATAMRQSLFSLANLSGGVMNITKTTGANDHETVAFSLSFSVGIPAVLVVLSNEMRDKPYRLDTANCQFASWRLIGCQITMTAKYLVYRHD